MSEPYGPPDSIKPAGRGGLCQGPWTQSFPPISHSLPGSSLLHVSLQRKEKTTNAPCPEENMLYSSDFQLCCFDLSLSPTCGLLLTLLFLDPHLLQTGQNSSKPWPAAAPKLPPFLRTPQFPFPQLSVPHLNKNNHQVHPALHGWKPQGMDRC